LDTILLHALEFVPKPVVSPGPQHDCETGSGLSLNPEDY
jgi:hypothetical protein